jgi:hypothetical protein
MTMIHFALPTVYGTSVLLLILQTTGDISSIGQIERIGLTGALLIAVGVLWRAGAKKDDQVMDMARQVSAALASNSDTQRELRAIVQTSADAKERLAVAIDAMAETIGRLPCSASALARRTAEKN